MRDFVKENKLQKVTKYLVCQTVFTWLHIIKTITKVRCWNSGKDNLKKSAVVRKHFSPLYALFTILDIFQINSSGNFLTGFLCWK